MKDLTALIEERARKGRLNSVSLIAGTTGSNGKPSKLIWKAHVREPDGTLSTGEHATDPISALTAALRGENAGINKTKKRSGARPDQSADDAAGNDFDFG
jgi:hypothetical protein